MDLLDINALFPQLILAIGAALAVGNGLALYHSHRGRKPAAGGGDLRRGRARFLLAVGLVMATWGVASLL